MLRIGSMFSGYGGLDLAVSHALEGGVVWHAENDKSASAVLRSHFPTVPNLGDVSQIKWDEPGGLQMCPKCHAHSS